MQMTIGLDPSRALTAGTVPPPPPPPSTALTRIESTGWSAIYPTPPTFDPLNAPVTVAVTRAGFSAAGTPASPVDTLTVMKRLRQPFPNQATLTADRVALSDYVYATDTVAGVTNNSTRTAPRPIAMWLNHDRERATGASHTLRLAVAHAHGRSGRPVAAVRFTVSDGTATVSQTVSAMTALTYSASGLTVPHFAAAMNLSTLAQGALLTVDAVIYPWVGAAFTISADGDTYPSPNLTTLRLLNDRTGAYGTAYAYVSAAGGNNATAVTSATPATAAAAPYATIAAAAAGIRAFNAATFGRSNDAGGGIVRLNAGVHTTGAFKSDGAAAEIPMTIEAADPAARATTVWTDGGASVQNLIPGYLRIRNITLRKGGGSVIFLDSGAGNANNKLIVENCVWDQNATSFYAGWVFRTGIFWQINNTGSAGQTGQLGTNYKVTVAMGCNVGGVSNGTYHAVGCRDGGYITVPANGNMPGVIGGLVGWNVFTKGAGTGAIVNNSAPVGTRGFALVCNVIESWGVHTDQTIKINADSDQSATQNVLMQHNTVVGERLNWLYLDTPVNAEKSGYVRFNVFQLINVKGDVFAQQSANIGNWSQRYKVGWSHNAGLSGSNNQSGYNDTSWMGELASLGEKINFDPLWTDGQSNYGGDLGGGDYTPRAASPLPRVPADQGPYGVDLFGRAVSGSGSAFVGAVQPA